MKKPSFFSELKNNLIKADNRILSRFHKYIPPVSYRSRVIYSPSIRGYLTSGKSFFTILEKFCSPNGRYQQFLDIGCGCGQVARFFTKYLDKNGRYTGFDIDKEMINWCKENISSERSDFKFHHIDIFNKAYAQTGGKQSASNFIFPFPNESFDVVFAKSVLTHLLPDSAENYLAQISRVLKPGGKIIITFFLLNERSKNQIDKGKSTLPFNHSFESYRSINKDTPEQAVCYEEKFILNLLSQYGFIVDEPIVYGTWPYRTVPQATYQDIVMAIKK